MPRHTHEPIEPIRHLSSLQRGEGCPRGRRTASGARAAVYAGLMLVCGAIVCGRSVAHAQINGDPIDTSEAVDTTAATLPRDFDLLSLGVEFVPSPGGGTFFDGYKRLGGAVESLGARMAPMVNIRLATAGPLRICLQSTYARASFTDIYGVIDSISNPYMRGAAALVDQFSATAIPVMAGVEYAPVRSQFTTYVGVGVGLAFNNVDWSTIVRSQSIVDFYRPGANVKSAGVGPAARVYAGTDFRFDRNYWGQGSVRGIFMEASYLLLPVNRDFFTAIRGSGKGIESPPDHDSGVLDLGGFAFTIGLNLQMVRR